MENFIQYISPEHLKVQKQDRSLISKASHLNKIIPKAGISQSILDPWWISRGFIPGEPKYLPLIQH
jgi:hypothetical protein